ncbi:MAG: hypothetical protein KDF59_03170 [Nitrosomonas sp.]|nr:hypothetical protein [Nitrosomonas sp.]
MTQASETTATTNQAATHAPAAESSRQKHQLIGPGDGLGVVWRLRYLSNAVSFLSQELERLKSSQDNFNEHQTAGFNEALFCLEQETESVRDELLRSEGAEVFQNVLKNIKQAENHFTFLMIALNPEGYSESRCFYENDIPSLQLNLGGIEAALNDALKQMEWFSLYGFSGNASLYKDSPSLIERLQTAIDDLKKLNKSFCYQDDDRCELIDNRESVAAEVRRLVEAVWDMSNMLPNGDLEKDLNLAHDILLHIYRVISSDIWLESSDLVSFLTNINNAKETLLSVYGEAIIQHNTGSASVENSRH